MKSKGYNTVVASRIYVPCCDYSEILCLSGHHSIPCAWRCDEWWTNGGALRVNKMSILGATIWSSVGGIPPNFGSRQHSTSRGHHPGGAHSVSNCFIVLESLCADYCTLLPAINVIIRAGDTVEKQSERPTVTPSASSMMTNTQYVIYSFAATQHAMA